jgi:hypothetical protein
MPEFADAVVGKHGGVFESPEGEGLRGTSNDPNHGAVVGVHNAGGDAGYFAGNVGVTGHVVANHGGVFESPEGGTGPGVRGVGVGNPGVSGYSKDQAGVVGESEHFDGVYGIAHQPQKAAVTGFNPNGLAGFFDGNVHVTHNVEVRGDVQLLGQDLAEHFTAVGESVAQPGCVVVLAGDGQVRVSDSPYDRRVAGVVSGAASYRPALILGNTGEPNRHPIALSGKVWCRVDADFGSIEVGDLLTTSPTPGHAMRAVDHAQAFGAVVGKALAGHVHGRGMVPILVALQ